MKQSEHTLETYVYNCCNICNISIYFYNTDIKHLQHTSETLKIYVCNTHFQRNISLLFGSRGSLARGVHRCKACRWRGARRSSREGRTKSDGEGHGGSTRSRRSRWARGVVEREKDGLLRSSAVEMLAGEAEEPWRGRRGGEFSH
jgi:hypothetical protein